jgi:hypothetical protein
LIRIGHEKTNDGGKSMKNIFAAAFVVFLLSLPGTAAACGGCVFEMFAYDFPHILELCYGITVWYCLVMLITAPEEALFPNSNAYYVCMKSFLMAALAYILGAMFFGPLSFGVLGILALYTTIKAFSPSLRQKISKKSKKYLKIVSLAAFIGIFVGIITSMNTAAYRSDADFILKYQGYQSNFLLKRLIAAQDVVQLRKILDKTTSQHLAEKVTEALAKIEKEAKEQ